MAFTDNTRGAGLMVLAMAAYTFNDTAMKSLAGEIPMFQAIFIRGALTTIWLFLLARAMGELRFNLSRKNWVMIALRTFSEAAATYFFSDRPVS